MSISENWSDVLQTIGATVIIVSAAIGLIPKFRELLRLISRWITCRWHMFSEWRYWKKHSPIISIHSFEPLYINEKDGTATLKVTVNWNSRENIFPTKVRDGDIRANIGKDIPLLLHRPQPNAWQLEAKDKVQKSYILEGTLGLRTKMIGSEVKCHFSVPSITLELLGGSKKISLKTYRIEVIRADN